MALAALVLMGAAPPEAETFRLHRVAVRLVAVSPLPDRRKFDWPPRFGIVEGDAAPPEVGPLNAWATALTLRGATKDPATGRTRPFIGITPRYLAEVVAGDDDVLALILGHELAHLFNGHCATDDAPGSNPGATPFSTLIFAHGQEYAADLLGVQLMVKAGFSGRRGQDGMWGKLARLGDRSPFESRSRSHPSWSERLARMGGHRPATGAMANGAYFLRHHYPEAAARCFEDVTRDLPASYEGWAGLGYARLMIYCEALGPERLSRLAAGGQVPGHEVAWGLADKALARAVEVLAKDGSPDARTRAELYRARANLALVRAVRPGHGPGTRQLAGALTVACRLPQKERGYFLRNAGLGDLAAATGPLEEAAQAVRVPGELKGAREYGEALRLAGSRDEVGRLRALDLLAGYLREANPGSPWALVAQGQHAALGRTLGRRPTPHAGLTARPRVAWRMPLSLTVRLPGGGRDVTVYLSEPLEEARKDLGAGAGPASAALARHRYPELGIDLLAHDQVVGICIAGKNAIPLKLLALSRERPPPTLRVGMTLRALEDALGGHSTSGSFRTLVTPAGGEYLFYPDPNMYADAPGRPPNYLGLAVKLHQGKVAELILAQVPPNPR